MNIPELGFVRIVVCGLLLILLGAPRASEAQVVNQSFEQDGQFSLTGWQVTDASCQEAFDETPPGGGVWSLKLHRSNLQGGCFGVAYQVISAVQSGVWRVQAWARVPEGGTGTARMYWTDFKPVDPSGSLAYMPRPISAVATVTSSQWTPLSLVDTLAVAQVDSIGIVLDGGLTSGPTLGTDFVYFDLIAVDQISANVAASNEEQPEVPALAVAHNFPNPFHASTTISFTLERPGFVTLDVYDMLGRKVSALLAGKLSSGTHAAVWEADTLPDGLYVGQLRVGTQVRTLKLVRLR